MDILHRASKRSHLPFFGTGIRTLGVLSVIGLFIALLVFPSSAVADDMQDAVDQAQSQLSAAEAQMEAIVADYHATEAEAESMQTRIDETAAAASQAQQAVNEGRDELGLVALSQYRASDSSLMLSLLLNATSFDDLLRQVTYFDAVMQQKADLIAEQKERVEQYNQLISELNAQKDAQDAKLAELEERRTEAQTLVENAQSQLTNAQGEQASRLAALAAASDRLVIPQLKKRQRLRLTLHGIRSATTVRIIQTRIQIRHPLPLLPLLRHQHRTTTRVMIRLRDGKRALLRRTVDHQTRLPLTLAQPPREPAATIIQWVLQFRCRFRVTVRYSGILSKLNMVAKPF